MQVMPIINERSIAAFVVPDFAFVVFNLMFCIGAAATRVLKACLSGTF